MSLQKIIKESVEKNPLGLREALEEELRNRVSLALEAKMKEEDDMDDEDDEDEDDEDEDDEDEDDEDDDDEDDEELEEDKFSDFWEKVFNDLDSKMKSFDGKKIADVNKVVKHLQQSMPKMPQSKAMSVATDYADYRSGKKSKDKAVGDVTKSMASSQKVAEAYNKDAVDKAIASADKKGKPTSSKGKKLIHALLKGRTTNESKNLDEVDMGQARSVQDRRDSSNSKSGNKYHVVNKNGNVVSSHDNQGDAMRAAMKNDDYRVKKAS